MGLGEVGAANDANTAPQPPDLSKILVSYYPARSRKRGEQEETLSIGYPRMQSLLSFSVSVCVNTCSFPSIFLSHYPGVLIQKRT